jgi:hypothetical protein
LSFSVDEKRNLSNQNTTDNASPLDGRQVHQNISDSNDEKRKNEH